MHWLVRGEDELPPDLAWLTPYEADRLAKMRFTKRRNEYLLRRWTAKHAVAAVTGIPAAQLARIDVRNRWTGAPHVHVDGEPLGIDLSLTDRAGWAVCLVAAEGLPQQGAVGVDLELVEPRSPGFVTDFLTPAEQIYLAQAPPAESDVGANLLWSAKEAALKVLQTGLRADTRSVEVVLSHETRMDGWAPLVVTTTTGRRIPGWWRRAGLFVLTLAYAEDTEPPALLASSADLTTATPVHSWLAHPVSHSG